MQGNTHVQIVTGIALCLYAVLMIVIGISSTKRAKSVEGFLLGSRKVGPWLTAFSYGTGYFSAVIFIGYAGQHGWNLGFSSMWIGIGNAFVGCLLSWLLLAKRTRETTQRIGAKTMPEFFEKKFGSTAMKVYAALVIFIFLVPYSAAVYKGLGSMFNVIFPGVAVWVIMLIIAVLSCIYLVLGGYVASSRTDFVQGVIMIGGVVAMVAVLLSHDKVGGITGAVEKLRVYGEADGVNLLSVFGGSNSKALATNILLTSIGTLGLPQMVSKYYAIRDAKSIKTATWVATGFCLFIGIGAYLTGSLGRIFLDNQMPAGGFDSVVPSTLLTALGDSNVFTTVILAVMLLLLLSASMSTLSAIVLSSASAISVDLLPVFRPSHSKKGQMVLTRLLCLLFIALSFLFAVGNISFIVNIMSFSWGVVAGSFIGPFIWGVCSKIVTKAGAWCGLLSGVAVVGSLTIYKTLTVGFSAAIGNAATYGITAMAVSLLLTPLVSICTKGKELKSI
ncbi:MAG: sodium:solute symporter [Clostridia bacterium]|nr:sodium:solute symporter [Clostridia bacterium]